MKLVDIIQFIRSIIEKLNIAISCLSDLEEEIDSKEEGGLGDS